MSDERKPGKRVPRLPRSGMADEILGQLARGELDGGTNEPPAPSGAEPRSEVDRIYTFTDSLQLGQEEEEEREVFETWVEFRLAGKAYALPVAQVREILRLRDVTPVPHPPFPVIGVINLRGRVVPLLDLRARLDLPTPKPGAEARVVLVESQDRRLGLLVDAVERVAQLGQSDIQEPPEGAPRELRGVHTIESRQTLLLDLAETLTSRE